MNKFRSKKKAVPETVKTNLDAFNSSTVTLPSPQLSPGLRKPPSTRWKKSKKPIEEKPVFDLSSALPSQDDFRTSLLMPNLSARFSMLREQDDPKSLLGKASDDSVLQPRRRSRLADFGFESTLNDIAEVSSIKGSIRPPFASSDRQHSFMSSEDDYGSETDAAASGSVMARARPGEGNILFGGRQKVYKIPMGGASSAVGRGMGRAVYEDDIGKSAFQKYKQRERELESSDAREDSGFDFGLDRYLEPHEHDVSTCGDAAKDLSHSPSLSSYDKKRSTTSSTARSEARLSTAATSVASQSVTAAPLTSSSPHPAPTQPPSSQPPGIMPMKRPDAKSRRLYDTGLDHHIQEQQTPTLTRLNSAQRGRPANANGKASPPYLHTAKSMGNLQERPPQSVFVAPTQTAPASQPPVLPLVTKGSIRKANPSIPSPPRSPVDNEIDDALSQALQPADRGKATAMGAFNKPQQQFDEQQYLERQQQLRLAQSRAGSRAGVSREPTPTNFHHQQQPQQPGRFEAERHRSNSNESDRSRSRSISATRRQEPRKYANAVQPPPKPGAQYFDKSSLPDPHRTFFGNISASDSEDEEDDTTNVNPAFNLGGPYNRGWQPSPLSSVSEHPAFRKSRPGTADDDDDEFDRKPLRAVASARSLQTDVRNFRPLRPIEIVDSPTLGALESPAQPLNGMVHHLRSKSNQSSIYPDDEGPVVDENAPSVPEIPIASRNWGGADRRARGRLDAVSRTESVATNSNPWDLEEFDHTKAPQISSNTRGPPGSRIQDISLGEDESWKNQLRKASTTHNREGSSATQQERDAFANELAARRNAIQENIKSIVERDAGPKLRGESPLPDGASTSSHGMLTRPRGDSGENRFGRDAPLKAKQMLGLGVNGRNSPFDRSGSRERAQPREGSPTKRDVRARNNSAAKSPLSNGGAWEAPRPSVTSERQRSKTRSPVSPIGEGRSRSNSGATNGRSRSTPTGHRDDLLAKPVPMISREVTPRESPAVSPDVSYNPLDGPGRGRSNSRAAMASYFDAKNAAVHPARAIPASHSQPTLSSSVYTPPTAASSGKPSPVASPFAHNMTPPLSGSNTPVFGTTPLAGTTPTSGGFPVTATVPGQMPGSTVQVRTMARKKTISKSDISEPTLISSTSNVDTVDLPEGASLKNGMDEVPPPVPPINPRRKARKLFGMGRSESDESQSTDHFPAASRTGRPSVSSDGQSAHSFHTVPTSTSSFPHVGSPPLQPSAPASSVPNLGSPERALRSRPLNGGMF